MVRRWPFSSSVEDSNLLEGFLALEKALADERDTARVAGDEGGAEELGHLRQRFLFVLEEQLDLVPHPADRDQLELGARLLNVLDRAG